MQIIITKIYVAFNCADGFFFPGIIQRVGEASLYGVVQPGVEDLTRKTGKLINQALNEVNGDIGGVIIIKKFHSCNIQIVQKGTD